MEMKMKSMRRLSGLPTGVGPITLAVLVLLAAGALAGDARAQKVEQKKPENRDWSYRLSPELREIVRKQRAKRAETDKTETQAQAQATPAAPRKQNLLKLHAPDQVVVAEVGGIYVLTRRELERMTIARHGTLELAGLDVNVARMRENRYNAAMDKILDEWALGKTFVLLAKQANLQVTPAEVDAQIEEARRAYIGENLDRDLARQSLLVGLDPAQMRREISDGLLIDKYIMREMSGSFTENDLQQVYNQMRPRYMTPAEFHGWQIVRRLDPKMSAREKKDLRAEFYSLRRRLVDAGEEKGGLLGMLGDKSEKGNVASEELFKEIASKESDDPRTRELGGDMGWIALVAGVLNDQVLAEFERLEIGEISRIVETETGLYILRVSERRAPIGATFDAVARKRVLDDLAANFKEEIGPQIMRTTPFSIHINSSGLWLLGQGPPAAKAKDPKSQQSRSNSPFSEFPE